MIVGSVPMAGGGEVCVGASVCLSVCGELSKEGLTPEFLEVSLKTLRADGREVAVGWSIGSCG